MNLTDICIVGAGPGGCSAALKLSQLGIPCTIIDKAVFPRDKVCGDGLTNKVKLVLGRIDPDLIARFESASEAYNSAWGARIISPNGRQLDLSFVTKYDKSKTPKQAYTMKRLDFDQWLVNEVKSRANIEYLEGISIEKYERTADGYLISNADGSFQRQCRLLIVANGAHSSFSRHHAGLTKEEKQHAAAVRGYFRHVAGLHPDGFIEFHFLKEFAPGYLWIFELPNGQANVGLFMQSDLIRKRRLNLTKTLQTTLANHPALRSRFQAAEMVGKIVGYDLPLGPKSKPISGDHFMLVGDAAHLIDPFSGEGIGNAIYSGYFAAEQAKACLSTNDFSANTLRSYDMRIARVLGEDMKLSLIVQAMAARPWLANSIVSLLSSSPRLVGFLTAKYGKMLLGK